ncbi:jg11207 [Pararge aegeria aegeria]|uniref:Jg11207 protein n=1 Tax=Pararge aegeria aegeria TaxID=348720 RepID=A0A8S4RIJ0_9NEOP|nr:jg11207 [Pararge aegeria aegeria]
MACQLCCYKLRLSLPSGQGKKVEVRLGISCPWKTKWTKLQFRRSMARYYLRGVGTKRPDRRRRKSSVVSGMNLDGAGHFTQKQPSQLRCVVCHTKAHWHCKKCNKTTVFLSVCLIRLLLMNRDS